MGRRVTIVRQAVVADAPAVTGLILKTFGERPVLDPPSTAVDETVTSVEQAIEKHGGLVALIDDEPVGALLFDRSGWLLGLRRVCVLTEMRHHGVAHHLTAAATDFAAELGAAGLALEARAELPDTVRFWTRQGYVEVDRDGPRLRMVKALPQTVVLKDLDATLGFGRRIGALVGGGDVVVLTGELGAGKTTFTQALAEGLGVRGPITSPTFVIARIHPSLVGGPQLVHVDAYRLGDSAELDDLDLDTDLDRSVTVVEWGAGLADSLSDARLEISLVANGDARVATITRIGARWAEIDVRPPC